MGHGGKREGAGRKKGSIERITRASLRIAAGFKARGKELPLEYMLHVMNDPNAPVERRDYMAVSAAPYCHQKQAAVAISAEGNQSVNIAVRDMSLQDMQAAFRQLREATPEELDQQLKLITGRATRIEDDDAEHDE